MKNALWLNMMISMDKYRLVAKQIEHCTMYLQIVISSSIQGLPAICVTDLSRQWAQYDAGFFTTRKCDTSSNDRVISVQCGEEQP